MNKKDIYYKHNALNPYALPLLDTLPPYLESTTNGPTSSVAPTYTHAAPIYDAQGSTINPVPYELRGSELTFEETGQEKTFMFAKNNTFIQMDGEIIQTFQLRY